MSWGAHLSEVWLLLVWPASCTLNTTPCHCHRRLTAAAAPLPPMPARHHPFTEQPVCPALPSADHLCEPDALPAVAVCGGAAPHTICR